METLEYILSIAIIGTITWLAIFKHNYHPRIYRYDNQVTILAVGESELDFNHPEGTFTILWQSGRRHLPSGGELGDEVPFYTGLRHAGGVRGFGGGRRLGGVAGAVDLVAGRSRDS